MSKKNWKDNANNYATTRRKKENVEAEEMEVVGVLPQTTRTSGKNKWRNKSMVIVTTSDNTQLR